MTAPTAPFRRSAYQIMLAINILLFIVSLGLAWIHNSWLAAFAVGLPTVLIPPLFYNMLGDHGLSRISYGVSFMFFSALLIHATGGMLEMHFAIFVLLAVLVAFRDYLVIITAALTIAIHHLLFMYLQMQDVGVYLVPVESLSLGIILLHALFVVVESVVLVIISRQSLREAQVGQALFDATEALLSKDNKIVLTHRCDDIKSRVINSFNSVLHTLQNTIRTIDSASEKLKQDAEQLLQDGNHLSESMVKKLAEVDRIAAATEQMSLSIREVTHLSVQVLEAAKLAEQAATEGQYSVALTIKSVSALSSQLGKTGDKVNDVARATADIRKVLDVIESIAEQTNLLALNAAIEAARAGEQGRGFAVVADEVRTLASRTRGSTDEIKAMIEQLVTNSNESVSVVQRSVEQLDDTRLHSEQSGQRLEQILHHAKQVAKSADIMSDALRQQSTASAEVAQGAQQISSMTSAQNEQGQRVRQSAERVEQITQVLAIESDRFVV
ncbi:methyl-accepting chemotaxis protein [Rheinheimera maricola]|uniref:Methyl-accepting chemotaxis protein n=1 Tax=Rheinheimera maricola TaxID=2793282 RepID=A0ABS7XAG1_9GAMM|nr:methyl-accepting chemotaxis protein [Rheinheimera maricola]MBZ9611772.1 methyl-accepting chemotaxis protein [Rheinheimera maricola]